MAQSFWVTYFSVMPSKPPREDMGNGLEINQCIGVFCPPKAFHSIHLRVCPVSAFHLLCLWLLTSYEKSLSCSLPFYSQHFLSIQVPCIFHSWPQRQLQPRAQGWVYRLWSWFIFGMQEYAHISAAVNAGMCWGQERFTLPGFQETDLERLILRQLAR